MHIYKYGVFLSFKEYEYLIKEYRSLQERYIGQKLRYASGLHREHVN